MTHEPPIYFDIFGRGGRPGNPKPPVVPPPPARGLTMHVVIRAKGALIEGSFIAGRMGRPGWGVDGYPIKHYMLEFEAPIGFTYGQPVSLLLQATGYADQNLEVPFAADYNAPDMQPERPPIQKRTGRVRLIGRAWSDDGGPYYPLGDTMLYALGHWWRGGQLRELVQENVAFIASYRHEFIRWLGEVNWAGAEIDPNWPNYEQAAAELLDWCYDVQGIRSEITVTGGGGNARLAAQKLRNVIAGREHKVLLCESVNETNDSGANAIWIAQLLKTAGVLVCTGRGNAGIETIIAEGDAAGSHVDTLHTERGLGDPTEVGGANARQVRQCWDFHKFTRAAIDGEGPGPASSVAGLDDPFYLALRRAANIGCGAGAQTCHWGAGVYGKDYQSSAGFRHAHFKDIPNIDRIMRGLRNADLHIPRGVENWTQHNTHPALPINIEREGLVNKINGCRSGPNFYETIIGSIPGPLPLKADQAATFKVVNPETGELLFDGHLAQGQVHHVEGLRGYVVVGVVD